MDRSAYWHFSAALIMDQDIWSIAKKGMEMES